MDKTEKSLEWWIHTTKTAIAVVQSNEKLSVKEQWNQLLTLEGELHEFEEQLYQYRLAKEDKNVLSR